MNMFEEAHSLSGMLKMCSVSQSELARKLGVSQSYIANKIRLLKFSPEVQRKISESRLTERHARALLRLNGTKHLGEALSRAASEGLTVQQTEALVDLYYDATAPDIIRKSENTRRIDTFKDTLRDSLATLRSLGVDATQTTSFYGTKTYITVCINES